MKNPAHCEGRGVMHDSQGESSPIDAEVLAEAVRNAQARDHEAFTLLFKYYKLG
jgi:hypothetical protein